MTTNEADSDDGVLSGALATVTGELPCEALTSSNKLTSESRTVVADEDEILSESPTVKGLLSGSPTVTDKITSELPNNEELQLTAAPLPIFKYEITDFPEMATKMGRLFHIIRWGC